MRDQTIRAKPEDLLWPQFHPDWCVITEDGWLGQVASFDGRARASVISNAARELGVRFQDIRCRVDWIRPKDRQDAWDEYGYADAVDHWADDNSLQWSNGAYLDADGRAHERPIPERVPDDWDAGDPWSVWCFCTKDQPGAVKVYVCEERDA